MAIKGLVQELIECSSEATECLYRDDTGIYNPSHHMAVVAVRGLNLFYSCNMGTRDLPDMHAQSLRMQPKDFGHTYQANHLCPFTAII